MTKKKTLDIIEYISTAGESQKPRGYTGEMMDNPSQRKIAQRLQNEGIKICQKSISNGFKMRDVKNYKKIKGQKLTDAHKQKRVARVTKLISKMVGPKLRKKDQIERDGKVRNLALFSYSPYSKNSQERMAF